MQLTDVNTKDKIEIRDEMKTFYQNIFNRQNVNEGTEAIYEFLWLDDDENHIKND